jgi:hypothetical protein
MSLIQTERALSIGDVAELRFVHDVQKLREFGHFLHGDTNLMNPSEIIVSSVEKSKAITSTCARGEKPSFDDSRSHPYRRVFSFPRIQANRLPRNVDYKVKHSMLKVSIDSHIDVGKVLNPTCAVYSSYHDALCVISDGCKLLYPFDGRPVLTHS